MTSSPRTRYRDQLIEFRDGFRARREIRDRCRRPARRDRDLHGPDRRSASQKGSKGCRAKRGTKQRAHWKIPHLTRSFIARMACEAGPRRCRYSGEGSRGFAQASRVHSGNRKCACKADARRAGLGRKVGRNRCQRGCAATRASAAAHRAGSGVGRQRVRRILGCGLSLGGFGSRGSRAFAGGRPDAGRLDSAVPLKAYALETMPNCPVTDMGLGGNGRRIERRSAGSPPQTSAKDCRSKS